jgi:hypothetical protein
MFPPATKSTAMPSVGEIMVTVFWNHTNVFIMDFLDMCYPFAMCTSKSEQSSRHQDICYPTFRNCFSVCDRNNNFLLVCLVQLWSTCCLKRLVLSHNLSEIVAVLKVLKIVHSYCGINTPQLNNSSIHVCNLEVMLCYVCLIPNTQFWWYNFLSLCSPREENWTLVTIM